MDSSLIITQLQEVKADAGNQSLNCGGCLFQVSLGNNLRFYVPFFSDPTAFNLPGGLFTTSPISLFIRDVTAFPDLSH